MPFLAFTLPKGKKPNWKAGFALAKSYDTRKRAFPKAYFDFLSIEIDDKDFDFTFPSFQEVLVTFKFWWNGKSDYGWIVLLKLSSTQKIAVLFDDPNDPLGPGDFFEDCSGLWITGVLKAVGFAKVSTK